MLSPGVTTETLSATPAATLASMFDTLVGFPVMGSVGSLCRMISKVRKRTPAFEAFERQNTLAPLYKIPTPLVLIVVMRSRSGETGVLSCCFRVLMYSVGYFVGNWCQ